MQGNKRRASQHSSVWIDPALSPYFTRKGDEQNANEPAAPKHPQQLPAQPGPNNARRRNPTTPIPPRASAQPAGSISVRPRYSRGYIQPAPESDVTRMPTLPPPTMWEYESPDFQAGSSLSSLSLVVDAPTLPDAPIKRAHSTVEIAERDTQPPLTQRRELTIDEIKTIPPASARRSELAIEEIDTIPPLKPRQHVLTVDEIDTIPGYAGHGSNPDTPDPLSPSTGKLPSSALMVVPSVLPLSPSLAPTTSLTVADASTSWTAGGSAHSRYAQRIAERKGGKGIVWYGSQDVSAMTRGRSPFRHPADRVRWWLLRPGHMEFALWIGGTILLMVVTVALLLATAVSLFWAPSHLATTPTIPANSVHTTSTGHSPASSKTGMTLLLNGSGPFVAGQALGLRGQGFTPEASISLTHDQGQPCQPGSVQSDNHGTFSVMLDDSNWAPGAHLVTARDASSRHTATLTIMLAPNPIGNKTAATPAATAPSTGGGVQSTPVNAGPTTTPTPQPSATSAPSPTPATPTPGITPTISPTSGTTPSTGTPSTGTPEANNPNSMSLDMAAQSVPLIGSWLLLLIALGCSAALLMLGVVGALMRRKRV